MRGLDLCPGGVSKAWLSASELESCARHLRAFARTPCGGLRDLCLGVEWAPSCSWKAVLWGGVYFSREVGRGKCALAFQARPLRRRPHPPPSSQSWDCVQREGSLAPGLCQSPRRKVPWGSDCVPPAGDGVGTQIEPINGVKAKTTLSCLPFCWKLEVRSGFQFCLVPNWEVCHLPVFFL